MSDVFQKASALLKKGLKFGIVRRTADFFQQSRTAAKVVTLSLITAAAVAVSLVVTGVTLGFSVDYAGEIIATVRTKATFRDAKQIAASTVKGQNADRAIRTPKYRLTLTVSDRLDSAVHLANLLIQKSDSIVSASALEINGEFVACAEEAALQNALQQRLNSYHLPEAENTVSFTDDVRVTQGYYLKSEILSAEQLSPYIDALSVKTVAVVTTETEIPFTRQSVKTDREKTGYVQVTTAGQNGLCRKTETVEMLNGVETARVVASEETVRQPVTEVTTIGTARVSYSQSQKELSGNAVLLLPLARGSYRISSYYGDGRNHKGIDMCADKGSSIFASAAGTVTYAGYRDDYGYSVVIDHGNGLSTRYAHASVLCVKQGDTVGAGQVIALVGRTGYATGDHVHFEVMVKGTRVNPAPYLGL